MSDFAGNEELLREFLTEASELLADVDNRLVQLEKAPGDGALLNAVFRSFHTIKGGAAFLSATELVELCHLTESLFDRLRHGRIALCPQLMDLILAATASVRHMFESLAAMRQPAPAASELLAQLTFSIAGTVADEQAAEVQQPRATPSANSTGAGTLDWEALLAALVDKAPDAVPVQFQTTPQALSALAQVAIVASPARSAHAQAQCMPPQPQAASQDATKPPDPFPSWGRRASDDPTAHAVRAGRRETDKVVAAKDATLRIDTARLDQVLNLSGEIGLARNRLNCLRTDILSGKTDAPTLRELDEAIGHLDRLVGELQNAVMKTRMQPVGRLFQKYPRLVRDLARSLDKEVELHLSGEETELDRSMIEELADPLVHLVRNAIDHGIETPAERRAAGKPEKGSLVLGACQAGDRIVIDIADDGRGIRTETLRRKAIEKRLSEAEVVHAMDDRQALQLIFLPGFSTKEQISSVSGRGVGMDVVKTNIQKLNGRIDVASKPGVGTSISISLPLTLAILPVLVVRLGEQPFALPLSIVREILRLDSGEIQSVGGNATVVIRDQVLPVRSLASMLDFPAETTPAYGVLLQTAAATVVLAVDGFVGRDDVVIKALEGVKAKGIAGATLSGEGSVVLVLDMEALLQDPPAEQRRRLLAQAGCRLHAVSSDDQGLAAPAGAPNRAPRTGAGRL